MKYANYNNILNNFFLYHHTIVFVNQSLYILSE